MSTKQKIYSIGKDLQLANFATMTEDGKPWVRYVLGQLDRGLIFRFSAHISSRKVKQIKKDPHVHITLGVSDVQKVDQWLQIQGIAETTTDRNERYGFWNDSIQNIFQGPDDPEYAVIIVKPYRIELEGMGSSTPEVWESSNK